MEEKKIAIVAGESSGDLHGAGLVRELKKLLPQIKIFGIGGDFLHREGVELRFNQRDISIVGFTEVMRHLPFLQKMLKEFVLLLEERRPSLLILIDYPGFNLRLAKQAQRMGIPIVYYISPQVWAWGRGRIRKIAKMVDKMIVVFPFEVELYRQFGLKVEFVGHPLLEVVKSELMREEFCSRNGLDSSRPILGLLPGSRRQELKNLLPIIIHSAEKVKARREDLQFILGLAPHLSDREVRLFLNSSRVKIKVLQGMTYELMKNSDLLLVASGTATLEAAILGIPMVIIYKVSLLSFFIAKALVKIPNIGLVNVVAGKNVVPELVQFEANPERISKELLQLLEDGRKRERIKAELAEVKKKLGEPGASERAAKIVAGML